MLNYGNGWAAFGEPPLGVKQADEPPRIVKGVIAVGVGGKEEGEVGGSRSGERGRL